MKVAILSVTEKGKKLSNNLKQLLEKDPTIIDIHTFHKNIKKNINDIFNDIHSDNLNNNNNFNNGLNDNLSKNHNTNFDVIIGIMATGILIRSIALNIQSKTRDPAIIAMDEKGKYTISLVSGHLGRANEITEKIAKLTNSKPVITTATDINNKIGIDTLVNKYYWEIDNKNNILNFNKAILEEKRINLLINKKKNKKIKYIDDIKNYLKSQNHNTVEIIDLKNEELSIENKYPELSSVDITEINRNPNKNFDLVATFHKHRLFFREKNMVLGIGAKANVSKEKVIKAIHASVKNLNIPIERINSIATAEIKANEVGILEAVKELKIPFKIITLNEIKEFNHSDISCSKLVEEKFGISGVCEPSALIGACENKYSKPKLIHKKTAIDGVTVAIAISS
ncbi:MAG: cobalamin biosynthesis protein [Methanobrevibacter sp.]|nr:cobalamin biosynthesis protein [Methanobrevibacter sp.]